MGTERLQLTRSKEAEDDMVGITKRDPMLDLLYQLEQRMGRSFNEPLRAFEWPVPEAATTAWMPLVDIFEEPDVIRLVAEIPGVKPEDVKISVEGNLLTVKGTKERSEEHTSELQSRGHLVCRLLLEKKKKHERRIV